MQLKSSSLYRGGKGEQAESVLLDLIERRGPRSETYGILGRVYKDRWKAAKKTGVSALARGLRDRAIATYLKGFEADSRDAYPGLNAVTLMTLREPPNPRREDLVPVVTEPRCLSPVYSSAIARVKIIEP
jgi:hypothetical protein